MADSQPELMKIKIRGAFGGPCKMEFSFTCSISAKSRMQQKNNKSIFALIEINRTATIPYIWLSDAREYAMGALARDRSIASSVECKGEKKVTWPTTERL
jgi:hypothetical protein